MMGVGGEVTSGVGATGVEVTNDVASGVLLFAGVSTGITTFDTGEVQLVVKKNESTPIIQTWRNFIFPFSVLAVYFHEIL